MAVKHPASASLSAQPAHAYACWIGLQNKQSLLMDGSAMCQTQPEVQSSPQYVKWTHLRRRTFETAKRDGSSASESSESLPSPVGRLSVYGSRAEGKYVFSLRPRNSSTTVCRCNKPPTSLLSAARPHTESSVHCSLTFCYVTTS